VIAPDTTDVLVFDTGPLSHFAKQGWLGILRAVLGQRTAVIPDTVVSELRNGVHANPHLQIVLDASWIGQRDLTTEYEEFATFSALLVGVDGRNVGEAGVLAYAKAHNSIAIVDDRPARNAAKAHNVRHQGTLALLCEGIRSELLTVALVAALADHLLESEYRLPFGPGGFEKWARQQGMV
jgi:predicted nucleic acid-binding protein